ncbi:MAG: hypothetical protein IJ565_00430 [Bacilli bacterium]|nr:hypothetical protein [Bacilli bacterium]
MNNELKRKLYKSSSAILLASYLTGCGSNFFDGNGQDNRDIKISIYNQEEDNSEEKVENKLDAFTTYDQNIDAYKVNIDELFSKEININTLTPYKKAYTNYLSNTITEYLGDDIYVSDETVFSNNDGYKHLKLYNLDDKSLNLFYKLNGKLFSIYGKYNDDVDFNVDVIGDSLHISYQRYLPDSKGYKYYKTYYKDKESTRGLVYWIDYDKHFIINTDVNNNLELSTEYGEAKMILTDDENATLIKLMDSYCSDVDSFLIEQDDLLNKYLIEVENSNMELYNNMINNIDTIKVKKLSR